MYMYKVATFASLSSLTSQIILSFHFVHLQDYKYKYISFLFRVPRQWMQERKKRKGTRK